MNLKFNSMCQTKKHSLCFWSTLMYKVYSHTSGRVARKSYRWLLEGRREWKFIGFLDRTHEVHLIERITSQGKNVVRRETKKIKQLPDLIICVLKFGPKLEKAAQKREKQDWAIEKQKLDNAPRLCGIYFSDPEDGEHKETTKTKEINCKSRWRRNVTKSKKSSSSPPQETERRVCKPDTIPKTKYACIVDAHESTTQRLESSLPKNHEDHFAGKGYIYVYIFRWPITIWFPNSFLCRKRWKFRLQKQQLTRTDKQQTQYRLTPKWKWRMLPDCPEFQSQIVQTYGYVFPRHKWPKSWSNIDDPVVPLERNLYGHPFAGLLWETQFQEILLELGREVPNWECLSVHRKQRLFLSVNVDDMKMIGKKQNMAPMWKKLMENLILTKQLHFLITYIWDALNVNVNRTKLLSMDTEICSNHEFLLEQLTITRVGKASRKNGCVFLWHGRTCSKMRGNILLAGKQQDRATVQSFKPLLGWSPLQERGAWFSWRNVKSVLTNCLDMLVLGANW